MDDPQKADSQNCSKWGCCVCVYSGTGSKRPGGVGNIDPAHLQRTGALNIHANPRSKCTYTYPVNGTDTQKKIGRVDGTYGTNSRVVQNQVLKTINFETAHVKFWTVLRFKSFCVPPPPPPQTCDNKAFAYCRRHIEKLFVF